jgi:hypothetical protein
VASAGFRSRARGGDGAADASWLAPGGNSGRREV